MKDPWVLAEFLVMAVLMTLALWLAVKVFKIQAKTVQLAIIGIACAAVDVCLAQFGMAGDLLRHSLVTIILFLAVAKLTDADLFPDAMLVTVLTHSVTLVVGALLVSTLELPWEKPDAVEEALTQRAGEGEMRHLSEFVNDPDGPFGEDKDWEERMAKFYGIGEVQEVLEGPDEAGAGAEVAAPATAPAPDADVAEVPDTGEAGTALAAAAPAVSAPEAVQPLRVLPQPTQGPSAAPSSILADTRILESSRSRFRLRVPRSWTVRRTTHEVAARALGLELWAWGSWETPATSEWAVAMVQAFQAERPELHPVTQGRDDIGGGVWHRWDFADAAGDERAVLWLHFSERGGYLLRLRGATETLVRERALVSAILGSFRFPPDNLRVEFEAAQMQTGIVREP